MALALRPILGAVLLAAGTLVGGPAPTAGAASWVAVDTVAGSGLASSLETWDATVVDYDGDGDQDVWVGYHDQGGRLFRNNGAGVYTRVAAAAWPRVNAEGMIPDRHLCAWADVDRNGLVDAYCSAGRGGQNLVKTGKDNELWLQTAVGQFREVGTPWGVGDVCGRSHYVAFLNANGDRYPDLFVGNASPRAVTDDPCDNPANGLPSEQSKLFLNQAGSRFVPVSNWGISGYGGTRCAEVTDVNRDGWDDLLVCGDTATKLYRNNAGTGFTDIAGPNSLAVNHIDADLGDLDGDGDQDLVTAVWGRVERRLNNGGSFGAPVRIYAVPSGGGGRAVSMGDADGDGDLDVYVLVSNLPAGTNPDDVVLRNNALSFTAAPVPRATGVGDAVTALDGNGDGRSEFLVLNGVETSGPAQRIELRLQ
jgi:type II secretory pathway pseudopilin PulG